MSGQADLGAASLPAVAEPWGGCWPWRRAIARAAVPRAEDNASEPSCSSLCADTAPAPHGLAGAQAQGRADAPTGALMAVHLRVGPPRGR